MQKIKIENNSVVIEDVDSTIPASEIVDNKRIYSGANAIDFLDEVKALAKHEQELFNDSRFASFDYELTQPGAVPPKKHRSSDSGFDLTLINIDRIVGRVVLFGTGVKVTPPVGYYFDLVPRSSMIKRGYILANSVGIIDQGYTGEILVPLIKIDTNAPDLELPATVVQLVPRKWYGFQPVERTRCANLSLRGDGGFGSTN